MATLLGTLVLYDPSKAREIIVNALQERGGNVTHAAKKLGVAHRTLCRWIAGLGLRRDLELIRLETGGKAQESESDRKE